MPKKIRVGVVFGGRSAEHEVSLVSAASVMTALDTDRYEILPIGITPEGRWLSRSDAVKLLKEKAPVAHLPEHVLLPDPRKGGLTPINHSSEEAFVQSVDVIFPVLHGTYGEDGAIQGLFELADIPYVGAGVLGSAVAMDKVIAKQLLKQAKVPVAPDIWFLASEYAAGEKKWISTIEQRLWYPCFVKPANLGSSVGISKAHDRAELRAAIDLASEYDRKILIERAVPNAREIEVSVLGNDHPIASVPGEVIPSNEFYDYDAKYVDGKSRISVPAKFTRGAAKKIQAYARQAFRVLNCEGMARVDFLVTAKDRRIVLSEINTIPGFTSISMYPKLWEASGVSYSELLDRLIGLALERHAAKKKLKTTYHPKTDWYKA
jgi:D-alanine-D-alanine ligase